MQVLEVIQDGSGYQDTTCADLEKLRKEQWNFDGTPLFQIWNGLDLIVRNPKAKRTDFLTMAGNKLVITSSHLNDSDFGPILKASGELLPITLDGNAASLLNVMPLSNCIVEDQCEWSFWEGKRDRLLKAMFDYGKVPQGRIFKVPQGRSRLLIAHFPGENRPDDFKAIYDRGKCKGLRYRLLWDSDDLNAPVVEF